MLHWVIKVQCLLIDTDYIMAGCCFCFYSCHFCVYVTMTMFWTFYVLLPNSYFILHFLPLSLLMNALDQECQNVRPVGQNRHTKGLNTACGMTLQIVKITEVKMNPYCETCIMWVCTFSLKVLFCWNPIFHALLQLLHIFFMYKFYTFTRLENDFDFMISRFYCVDQFQIPAAKCFMLLSVVLWLKCCSL